MNLNDYITDIIDYPKKGIIFKDITTLIMDPVAFNYAIDKMAEHALKCGADVIIGPESRGFIFGAPVAYKLKLPFLLARKKGKLPRKTRSATYELEYGTDEIFIHDDAIKAGQKVFVIDDIVALGGTLNAVVQIVESFKAEVVGMSCLLSFSDLPGEKVLKKYNLLSLISCSEKE